LNDNCSVATPIRKAKKSNSHLSGERTAKMLALANDQRQ